MASNEIMTNRQNSLSNFANTAPSTSLYSPNTNTPSLFASTNTTSGYEFGQSQQRFTTSNFAQVTSPGFGLQQGVGSFSNGQLNAQQKTSYNNTFMSNINQNQLNNNNNNHLYSNSNTNTSNANFGWHNINK